MVSCNPQQSLWNSSFGVGGGFRDEIRDQYGMIFLDSPSHCDGLIHHFLQLMFSVAK